MKKKTTEKRNTVTIPSGLTAKEIYDSCKNTTPFGKQLLYGDWFKGEKFWDTETTRAMTVEVPKFISYAGSPYDDMKGLVGEERVPNVAEVLWMMKSSGEFYDLFHWRNDACWTWTSTKLDDGNIAYLGRSGVWDSRGSRLSGLSAGDSYSVLGLGFSCTASGTDEKANHGPKEAVQADGPDIEMTARLKEAVELCKDSGLQVSKIL